MMLGSTLAARKAEEIGLIWKAVPGDTLADEAYGLARHLATQPTAGLGLIKRALNASLDNTLDDQLDLEAEYQGLAGRTHDYQEGVAAFLAKRAPTFTGR